MDESPGVAFRDRRPTCRHIPGDTHASFRRGRPCPVPARRCRARGGAPPREARHAGGTAEDGLRAHERLPHRLQRGRHRALLRGHRRESSAAERARVLSRPDVVHQLLRQLRGRRLGQRRRGRLSADRRHRCEPAAVVQPARFDEHGADQRRLPHHVHDHECFDRRSPVDARAGRPHHRHHAGRHARAAPGAHHQPVRRCAQLRPALPVGLAGGEQRRVVLPSAQPRRLVHQHVHHVQLAHVPALRGSRRSGRARAEGVRHGFRHPLAELADATDAVALCLVGCGGILRVGFRERGRRRRQRGRLLLGQ